MNLRTFLAPRLLPALLLVAVSSQDAMVQAQELEWVTAARGDAVGDLLRGAEVTAVDEQGNSYLTRSFIEPVGPDPEMPDWPAHRIGVGKLAPDGTLLWATSAGHIEYQGLDARMEPTGIAFDAWGHTYVVGDFSGDVVFGAGEPNETVLEFGSGAAFYATFLAKFGPDGALLWATRVGGGWVFQSTAIAMDALGNSYVTGSFGSIENGDTIIFGAGEPNQTVLTHVGDPFGHNLFVAKYAPDGTLLWAKGVGDSGGDGVATDPLGNVYITGDFGGPATFGAGEANETILEGRGCFIAKYASDGSLLLAKVAADAGDSPDDGRARVYEIVTDSTSHSYVLGEFAGTVVFGRGEPNEIVLTGPPPWRVEDDIVFEQNAPFLAKYAPDGTLVWVKPEPDGVGRVQGIATDSLGNSYLTGEISGAAVFGEGEANETVLTSAEFGRFVAKYASDGTLLWATGDGGSADGGRASWPGAIAADPLGSVYISGHFEGPVVFAAGKANETVLEGEGYFTAKYVDRAKEDSDIDGVPDAVDVCPGTVLPEIVPTSGWLAPYRYAIMDEGPAFSTGDFLPWQAMLPPVLHEIFTRRGTKRLRPSFTILDTHGCSCEQIIDHLNLGPSHRKIGCSLLAMRAFIRRLPAE